MWVVISAKELITQNDNYFKYNQQDSTLLFKLLGIEPIVDSLP